jgi:hypothetical protein
MTSSQCASLIGLTLPSSTTVTILTVRSGAVAFSAPPPLRSAGTAGGGPGEHEQAMPEPPSRREVATSSGEGPEAAPAKRWREGCRRQEAAVAGRAVVTAMGGRGRSSWAAVKLSGFLASLPGPFPPAPDDRVPLGLQIKLDVPHKSHPK